MSILRLAFAWQNASFFESLQLGSFVYGALFDAVTIALLALPYAFFSMPLQWKASKFYRVVGKSYLFLIALFVLVLNT